MPIGEPGGPDSEVFFEFTHIEHDPKWGEKCHPNCDCGRFMEIGNSVFMQYIKKPDGGFEELPQLNVDFGGGLERIAGAAEGSGDMFKTDALWAIIEELQREALQNTKITHQHFVSSQITCEELCLCLPTAYCPQIQTGAISYVA